MKGGNYKKYVIFLIISLVLQKNALSYSDSVSWTAKKTIEIDLITNFIANRESYSQVCYRDGNGWSVGFGDYALCSDSIKVLKWQHAHLKQKSDDYVRNLIKIDKKVAKWRLKKFIISCYERLEKIKVDENLVIDILDIKQITSIIDNMYTRGETRFYKGDLWLNFIIPYVSTKKINCVKASHAFLSESKNAIKRQRNGVLARRLVELLDFTHKSCVYDTKFLITTLNKYQVS